MQRRVCSIGAVVQGPDAATQASYDVFSAGGSELARSGQQMHRLQEKFTVENHSIPAGLAPSQLDTTSPGLQHPSAHLRQEVSLEWPHQYSTVDSYGSSDTGDPQPDIIWDNVDPRLLKQDGPSDYQGPTYAADMQQMSSPSELTTATPSPASAPHQGESPLETTGYAPDENDDYFGRFCGYSHDPVSEEQPRRASGFQGQGRCPGRGVGGLAVPSMLPGPPMTHDEEQDTASDHLSPSVCVCDTCGTRCKRLTDLHRHQDTACLDSSPKGPACPEEDCRFKAKFTRADNFKVHYKKQHGKTDYEAVEFIDNWKGRGRP